MRGIVRTGSVVLFLASLLAWPVSSAPTPTPGAKALGPLGLPDLILEGPDVSQQGDGAEAHTYTVRNGGDADAHSTRLRLRCEVVHVEHSGDGCLASPGSIGSQQATLFADVPPLQKGSAVPVIVHPAIILKHGLGNNPAPLYRLKFTADLDPDATLTEKSRANNHLERTEENFTGPLPVSAAKVPVLPALTNTPVVVSGNVGDLGIRPQLKVSTEKPWTPAQSDWIIVKNVGTVDAPAGTLNMSCEMYSPYNAGALVSSIGPDATLAPPPVGPPGYQPTCTKAFYGEQGSFQTSTPVPALSPGAWKSILEIPAAKLPAAMTVKLILQVKGDPSTRLVLGPKK